MSLHKVTAGSGYDYLTRQVAAMDSTERGHTGLASYYTEKGETPGVWLGSGMGGIEGLSVGDRVTTEHMQNLFGAGLHPLAQQRAAALSGTGAAAAELLEATRLGRPFRVYANDVSAYRVEVARRLEVLNTERGLPRAAAVSAEDRARVRTVVATERFVEEYGRPPLDERELAGHVARLSRQQTTAVAGFDLAFSPVKSVSALWAVADPAVAATIERAHNAAISDALGFIERCALFTRTGTNGIRQVDVRGLVATAWTHRDSRAGDPDLHTHVAIANKVQTAADGRWLAIDGRVLHKAAVTASEVYNTALEQHLHASLGLRFAERPNPDRRKRPIREVVGVDPKLTERWSQRRRSIDVRRRELAAQFRRDHGRPPTPVEMIVLSQQATLETREGKHEPRSLAEQRQAWYLQALEVLGSAAGIRRMVRRALHPNAWKKTVTDQDWFDTTTAAMVSRMEQSRSTWQDWHLRAEAQRHIRAAEVPRSHSEGWVERLVAAAIRRSVRVCRPDSIAEPAPLRRVSGDSVYTVAGSQLYTSRAILTAEQRLVAAAGRRGGMVANPTAIDLALLNADAYSRPLTPSQVLLIREMASSGARLQLAIAPAGSGKTTAMAALSQAWTSSGGTVIGLAPSAAAAAALGDQLQGHSDTMAKLVWSLQTGFTPDWVTAIGPKTLVVIDEAGMADTISLEAVVRYVLNRGGSVRLIGDDCQLAAIGAGGVLRDIQATHGALQLRELVRFADPAEGSASLALRQGHTEALGFYLDAGRIHIGDQDEMADDLFAAWSADRAQGLDSIMLAPTREQVAALNQRARSQRLAGSRTRREVTLADGLQASAGDTIITRQNDRKLPTAAGDWVKNGDRWLVVTTHWGRIRARHMQTGRLVTLPAKYVRKQVELGYASTVHTAQGITADTMHGLLTGAETRQQSYTMLTRGRLANHVYVAVVGDGDPHTLIHPDVIQPVTPTDILERILARDESPVSATTQLRDAGQPATLLHHAAQRYTDAVGFAAEHLASDVGVRGLERRVEAALPGITQADAWPALRAELLIVEADGDDPILALTHATEEPLETAQEPAAVLAWRVNLDRNLHRTGPLPWLPKLPDQLAAHSMWGPYLQARAQLVRDLAGQVRDHNPAAPLPDWATNLASAPSSRLVGEVEVWRAASGVPTSDLRPTGEHQTSSAASQWQRRLDHQLASSQSAALAEWGEVLAGISSAVPTDNFAPRLAQRLSQLSSSGINARQLLREAAGVGPLPDDHAAGALWWRMARHLTPAVAEGADATHHLITAWSGTFTHTVGEDAARKMESSPWWPALVATIEQALQRGWNLNDLIADARQADPTGHLDTCQAWTWRLSLRLHPIPHIDPEPEPQDAPPADLWDDYTPSSPHYVDASHRQPDNAGIEPSPDAEEPAHWLDHLDADQALAIEAVIRRGLGTPEPTDAEIRHMADRADAWRTSPPRSRLVLVNQLTADYYERCFTSGAWTQDYVAYRFGRDLAGSQFRPGYAPNSWTALVSHLRRRGITDEEMITAGVALQAKSGQLVDRFRDRATFPITDTSGTVLGFIARRNPRYTDDQQHGPKYLNTPETPLYSKRDQLYIAGNLTPGTTPVLVEGVFDAIATTLASDGSHVGTAALGTSLTTQQVAQLSRHPVPPVVATDPDKAGRLAAERDFWLLAAAGMNPRNAALPEGRDPADLLTDKATDLLIDAISNAAPLADSLISQRIANLPTPEAALEAVRVVAAQPPEEWSRGVEHVAERTGVPSAFLRSALVGLVRGWNTDPRRAAEQALSDLQQRNSHPAGRSRPVRPIQPRTPGPLPFPRPHPEHSLAPPPTGP